MRRLLTRWSGPRPRPAVAEPELGPLLNRADALRDAGHLAEAASAYQDAVSLAPDQSYIRVQLGNMLKDSGQLAEAEAVYRQALAQSDQADTHLQLGHTLKAIGNRSGALSEYRRALELDPGSFAAAQELAEAGDPTQQQRRFDAQMRAGGVEAVLALSHAIAAMQLELDRLSRALPEALARTSFPIDLYDSFRDVFPVPAPPHYTAAPGVAFHIILLADPEELGVLFAQLGAIQAQSRPAWTLSVLGASTDRRRVVELAAAADPRISWVEAETEAAAALAPIAADWLLLLAPGAMLDPQALAWFAAAAAWSPAPAFVCDEEKGEAVRTHLVRTAPELRQVVDYDSLLEANVFGETIAIRRAAYHAALASLPETSITAARTALLLALASQGEVGHVPYPLVWRHAPAAVSPSEHQDGVLAHLRHAGLAGRITFHNGQRPAWLPSHPEEAIAVIISTRDNAADLRDFIASLRQTAASPRALEFVVTDNGSARAADLETLRSLAADGVQVERDDAPFNWSLLNNRAVERSRAGLLLFANDDMKMISPGWDMRLRGLLERPDIGAVGARLLFDDDTVQHAGVLFGWKGSVIHDGLHEPASTPGPASRWHVSRAVGAVTGAFLATTRDRFLSFGGFDAQALPVAYSDIDYAMKLRAAGLRILWTPSIELFHHESKTRSSDHADPWRAARNAEERAVMEARWGDAMEIDPGVHPSWLAATLPFRLLTAPPSARTRAHIVRTGSRTPWAIEPAGPERRR